MSLTLAAVQVPYHPSPYQQSRFLDTTSPSYRSIGKPAVASHSPKDLLAATNTKYTRWSSSSESSDGTVEDSQMSSYGSASQPTYDQDRERPVERFPQTPSEHVLPPIVSPRAISKMQRQDKQSPSLSPNFRPGEASDQGPERRGQRLIGVHSILNPSHGEEDQRYGSRRVVSEMDGERRTSLSGAAMSVPSTGPPTVRRILTPISPRLIRATSYGSRITGTIDAAERPFLSDASRHATPEHISNNKSLPVLPQQAMQVVQHSQFVTPAAPTPPLIHPARRASVSVVGSTRPSPSPSYADSYSQGGMSGQTSPSMHPMPGHPPGPTPPGSMRLDQSPNLGPVGAVPPGSLDNEQGFHGPVVSSGQNYQILTVDTSKGHMQLPVEVQAASRMADEKRKRNAGASARFRARRKEKEREAASKISNLEHDLLCAQEDSRHYKAERDFLADIIARYAPQYESHMKNRPPSPRHKRGHHVPHRAPLSSIDSPISTVDSEQFDDEPPSSRRRTESYSFPNAAGAGSQHQYPPAPYNQYPPGHAQLPAPQQHGSAQYAQQSGHVQGPPPPLLARHLAGHEVHRQDHGYERGWPRPGPGGQPH